MRRLGMAEKRKKRAAAVVAERCQVALNSLSSDEYYKRNGLGAHDTRFDNKDSGFASDMRGRIFGESLTYVRERGPIGRKPLAAGTLPGNFSSSSSSSSTPGPPVASGGIADLFQGYGRTRGGEEALKLSAANVDLPEQAGTADLAALLTPGMSRLISDERLFALPKRERPVSLPRAATLVESADQYVCFVRRLFELGMVVFRRSVEVVNGCFGVSKGEGEKLRFIANLKPANACFPPPPELKLSGPDLLGALEADAEKELFCWKYDIRAAFHRFKTPSWMWKYFALRKVPAKEFGLGKGFVFPCLTTLPMGFSWAPFLCQEAHGEVVASTGLPRGDLLLPENDVKVDRLRYGLYIDDGYGFSTSLEEANRAFFNICEALAQAGLSVKETKCVRPSKADLTVLGLEVKARRGRVGPAAKDLKELIGATEEMLARGCASGLEMSRIVGKWSWVMLLSRFGFSIFSSVYTFMQKVGESGGDLWPSVRKELGIVCGVAPLLCVSFFQKWSDKVAAFDASKEAQGVSEVLAPLGWAAGKRNFLRMTPSVEEQGRKLEKLGESVRALSWTHVVSSRFRHDRHINLLEAAACLTSVRRAAKDERAGLRCVVLGDSTAVISAVAKGRCSSFPLLVAVRRIMALCLASGVRPLFLWIASENNPADAPSRPSQVFVCE